MMPGRRRQIHAYQPDEIDKLKGVALPEKIKCGRCYKNLPQAKFSLKQLTDARYRIRTCGKITPAINCQPCTGQQVVEVECTMCGKTKGLEDFAKSQRNKPDTAKCFKCIEAQLADQAINEDIYENPENAFLVPDHSAGKIPEYFSSATSSTYTSSTFDESDSVNDRDDNEGGGIALSNQFRQAMSITGSADESLIGTEYAYPAPRSAQDTKGNGDGWSEARTKSWRTQSNATPSTSSGFNPNAYGRPSTSSFSGSARSFASSAVERSITTEMRSNGWAKIRAAPSNSSPGLVHGPPMVPMGDGARERESVVNAWDSDDDEEDDDDDDEDSDDETVI